MKLSLKVKPFNFVLEENTWKYLGKASCYFVKFKYDISTSPRKKIQLFNIALNLSC